MNDAYSKFLLTVVLLIFISVSIPFIVRSIIWNRFLKMTKKGDAQQAKKILTSRFYKLLFSEYDQNWNLLRLAMATDNKKDIDETTNKIIYSNASKSQKYKAASNVYFYYLEQEDKQMCDKLLDIINNGSDKQEINHLNMLYRVFIEKKSDDIEEVKNMLEKQKDELEKPNNRSQRGILEYILGLQYLYMKDSKEADKWLGKARKDLKGSPFYNKVKNTHKQI